MADVREFTIEEAIAEVPEAAAPPPATVPVKASPAAVSAEAVHEVDLSDEWASMLEDTKPLEAAKHPASAEFQVPAIEQADEFVISDETETVPGSGTPAAAQFEISAEPAALAESASAFRSIPGR